MNALLVLAASAVLAAPLAPARAAAPAAAPAAAKEAPSRDPRNWPTITRLVVDRYEVAGQVFPLRVHARRSDYFNCSYRASARDLMAFTLLGGPLETLTGYMPRALGTVLEGLLARDPWTPITVQVRFDPERVNETCPDQVDILKWAQGWQYPSGSLTPGRPDPTVQALPQDIDEADQAALWRALLGRARASRKDEPTEEELVGKVIRLTAGARLTAAYFCLYKGAIRTHYALRLHDGKGSFVHAYVTRGAASRELVYFVALHRDVLIEIDGRVGRQTPSNYCRPQIEISGWSFPRRTTSGP